jgi:hypothetical protein
MYFGEIVGRSKKCVGDKSGGGKKRKNLWAWATDYIMVSPKKNKNAHESSSEASQRHFFPFFRLSHFRCVEHTIAQRKRRTNNEEDEDVEGCI